VHQEDGGGHADWNLVAMCSGHHTMHHRGWLAIEGRAPDAIRFEWRRPPEEIGAHVGTNDNQRAHVGTNASQVRAHVGTNHEPPISRFGAVAMRTQARDALVGLGWKPGIAKAAVEEACASVGTDAGIELLIREALRRCPKPLG